jgi:DNA-binding MarR family transcriptional regulator
MTRPIDAGVGYALKRAQQALRTAMDRSLAAHGLTTSQYAALAALEREPGLSNAELARRSFVTPQTMIQIVTLLEREGMLERSAGPGRVLEARLTRTGAKRVAAAHVAVETIEARMVAGLSPAERDRLGGWLTACADALEPGPANTA